MKSRNLQILFILTVLAASTSLIAQPASFKTEAKDGLDSLAIWVDPGESRPFMLANRNGTYFYGSTVENGWDSGWMGLWVNRKRVVSEFSILDSTGTTLPFSNAWCRVTPADVTWSWKDGKAATLFFASRQDTMYWRGSVGLKITSGSTWIQPSPTQLTPPLRTELLSELHNLRFVCGDTAYSKAVAWAHLQLLFLLAENDSLLYAGIPWFNEGWGRDTFISLPGLLVTGHTEAARKLLLRYAGWVDRDSTSMTYGRVPNRVRPGEEIAYNTADGTPWWIRELYEYGLYTRDYDLWKSLLAEGLESNGTHGVVFDALEGALARSDSLGFLKHGDGDTWMDAVGPNGPVTPRGNRAVEIAALHYAALDAAIRMASSVGDPFWKDKIKKWRDARMKLAANFNANFITESQDRLYDRLHGDGTPDSLVRPNQLFALTVPLIQLVPPQVQTHIVKSVCEDLVHPYGVLSLSPEETLFHPFHMDEHYPKDDAYHNGVVWVWLSGPAKTALRQEGRADLSLKIANYEADLMLQRGCVGSLPELLDAMPRRGAAEPNLSGTVSQAWSLAEFLRTTYQDFLGIRPVLVPNRIEPFWLFDPRVPKSWGRVEARVTLEGTPVMVTMQNYGDSVSIMLRAESEPKKSIGIKAFDSKNGITGFLGGTEPVHLVYRKSDSTAFADKIPTAKLPMNSWPYDRGNQEIALAKPITRRNFPCLRKPDWDVLSAKEALRRSQNSKLLFSKTDDEGDDIGSGTFTYPLDENFKPGILDLTGFELHEDKKSYFFTLQFKNLVQPGWHPEYGFQLTFTALCLHNGKGKRTNVGANSNYMISDSNSATRIIYVGGGIRVEDENGNRLAEFTPREPHDALGDTSIRTINFSLPKKYFPKRSDDWSWTVLVGAQDDHGGAGMGEFRTVKPVAEKWAGGGNTNGSSNIYDVLTIGKTH